MPNIIMTNASKPKNASVSRNSSSITPRDQYESEAEAVLLSPPRKLRRHSYPFRMVQKTDSQYITEAEAALLSPPRKLRRYSYPFRMM